MKHIFKNPIHFVPFCCFLFVSLHRVVLVDSGETSVWVPYWSLAEETLRKSEKATKGRGVTTWRPHRRFIRIHKDHQLRRLYICFYSNLMCSTEFSKLCYLACCCLMYSSSSSIKFRSSISTSSNLLSCRACFM